MGLSWVFAIRRFRTLSAEESRTVQSMAVAAFIVSLLALAVSGIAAWSSHRQANAAEDQVEILRAEQAAAAAKPPWLIEHHAGDRFNLTKRGTAIAYDVTAEGTDLLRVLNFPEVPVLAPNESVTFLAPMSLQRSNGRLTVRWSDEPGGETKTWTRALPPKKT